MLARWTAIKIYAVCKQLECRVMGTESKKASDQLFFMEINPRHQDANQNFVYVFMFSFYWAR